DGPSPLRLATQLICAYRLTRRPRRFTALIGCGIDVSPVWARASVPGFASSSIQTDADMTPRVENSHTLRVNPSDMSLRWLAIASDNATPPTQPITPDSNVVVHERRTPSSRPTSQARTRT